MSDLALDPVQLDRYSRHIFLDRVGSAGQQALLESRVLVIGAGGLGSPIIQYLAAAGVGTLGIIDDDVVERSNLQRQIIHRDAEIGISKVESAQSFIEALNPDVTVHAIEDRLTSGNIYNYLNSYDVVVDGSDNFETRFLVNDACSLTGIPLSHGAIYQFEGQVTTFTATDDSPCYRCIFPEAPPPGTIVDCATGGVLGVLPGTVGCIQATETVKTLMGIGDLLRGRLVLYDALGMTFDTVPIQRNPACPVCGDDPAITDVTEVDYAGSCQIDA